MNTVRFMEFDPTLTGQMGELGVIFLDPIEWGNLYGYRELDHQKNWKKVEKWKFFSNGRKKWSLFARSHQNPAPRVKNWPEEQDFDHLFSTISKNFSFF